MIPPSGGRVGLVLGAGGTVGEAFHAGTLAALADAGWDARDAAVIVGTSTGAVTGALLRAGMAPDDLFARVTGEPMSPEGSRILAAGGGWPQFPGRDGQPGGPGRGRPAALGVFARLATHPWRTRPGLLFAAVGRVGAVSPDPIATGFDGLFDHRWPAQPFRVCAVDVDTGERVVIGDGDIGTAVAASCAVPSYFRPVVVAGRRLIDGGAHSPVNADVIADALPHVDCVVVSAPMAIGEWPGRPGLDLPGRVLNHLFAVHELRAVREAGVPVLLVEPTARQLELMHYDSFDPRHLPEIARRAREAVATTTSRSVCLR